MKAEYKQKQNNFRVQIRRKAIDKMFQEKRNQQAIQKMSEQWSISADEQKYSVESIIRRNGHELLEIPSPSTKAYEQPGENVQKQQKISLDRYLSFWSFFLREVYLNREKYSETIMNFLLEFVRRHRYRDLLFNRALQNNIINVLEMSVRTAFSTSEYRATMLRWVMGSEGITLIYESVFNDFLDCDQFPTVYEVIIKTLCLKKKSQTEICCKIIDEMMKSADEDDVFKIYERFPHVAIKLMEEALVEVNNSDITYIANALLLLIDSFPDVKEDYMRDGLGYLIARMLTSQKDVNVEKGLEMISWVTQCGSKVIIDLLIDDREINEAGLWKQILTTGQFLIHPNPNIKQPTHKLLSNIFLTGQYSHIEALCNNFQAPFADNILHYIKMQLANECHNLAILMYLLNMLHIMVYYGGVYRSEDGKNIPYEMAMDMGMEEVLNQLSYHENERVRELTQGIINLGAM